MRDSTSHAIGMVASISLHFTCTFLTTFCGYHTMSDEDQRWYHTNMTCGTGQFLTVQHVSIVPGTYIFTWAFRGFLSFGTTWAFRGFLSFGITWAFRGFLSFGTTWAFRGYLSFGTTWAFRGYLSFGTTCAFVPIDSRARKLFLLLQERRVWNVGKLSYLKKFDKLETFSKMFQQSAWSGESSCLTYLMNTKINQFWLFAMG